VLLGTRNNNNNAARTRIRKERISQANNLQKMKITLQKDVRRRRLLLSLCLEGHDIPKSQTIPTVPPTLTLHTTKYFRGHVRTTKSRVSRLSKIKVD
jgi:hypothetical protein